MKVRWTIEGSGCQFQQCGLAKGHIVNIEDADLPTDPVQREKAIDSIVQETFEQHVYPVWELKV
jgi:hypothetical protein